MGKYDLLLVFSSRKSSNPFKSILVPFQYSKILNKLFINQNRVVHIHFNVRNREDMALPEGLMIRAVVIYTRPDDFEDPVHVCPSHSKDR